MSALSSTSGRAGGALSGHIAADAGEAAEIRNLGDVARIRAPAAPAAPVPPAADEASLPLHETQRDPVLATLARALGERLSTDNLAWRGDPVPVMRSLQKMLVAHSLSLAEEARQPAMDAIRTVELAVRWRLRWAQMRRSEAERHIIDPEARHATQKSA